MSKFVNLTKMRTNFFKFFIYYFENKNLLIDMTNSWIPGGKAVLSESSLTNPKREPPNINMHWMQEDLAQTTTVYNSKADSFPKLTSNSKDPSVKTQDPEAVSKLQVTHFTTIDSISRS